MNWMRYKFLYFGISAVFIAAGIFGLLKWGLKLGVDFTGGSLFEYKFNNDISTEKLTKELEKDGFKVTAIQTSGDKKYAIKFAPLTEDEKNKITDKLSKSDEFKGEQLSYQTVGPSIGGELIQKTIYALVISAGTILLWVAYQFKNLKFGVTAILAMFHDSFVLLGAFAVLGHFYGAEVDFLFVTAMLTILSFSVHDTIVVFDRIRETHKKFGGSLSQLADQAVSETMVRSLNNSFTIVFMLVALVLLGGSTVKWFAIALLIGTISGTYSSPFTAVPLLVLWDELQSKLKKRS